MRPAPSRATVVFRPFGCCSSVVIRLLIARVEVFPRAARALREGEREGAGGGARIARSSGGAGRERSGRGDLEIWSSHQLTYETRCKRDRVSIDRRVRTPPAPPLGGRARARGRDNAARAPAR